MNLRNFTSFFLVLNISFVYSLQTRVASFAKVRSNIALAENNNENEEIFQSFDDEEDNNKAPQTVATDKSEDDEFQKVRVLTYMGLSLVPIIAIFPFFAGRDFVPADPSQFT
mmetsp:Transcript_13652/g.20364  ORF Transcript_13652/g.20364 Transcript_13652/m.20364 type:complete len:112 (-) Transcript_13652:355-690(-)